MKYDPENDAAFLVGVGVFIWLLVLLVLVWMRTTGGAQ